MLQHKHPFGSSKNSSDSSAVGSSSEEILIAFAVEKDQRFRGAQFVFAVRAAGSVGTFNILVVDILEWA